jgi:hypothetical protein
MTKYRAVGFLRGGDESTYAVDAKNDADAWASVLPAGFLLLRLEKRDGGDGWEVMRLDAASLMREIDGIMTGLTAS